MLKNIGLNEFEKALKMLDEELGKMNKSISIYAIGGFAMMYRGVAEHGYTMDIDSLIEKYDEETLKVIRDVGIALEIDEDWLNNDCATLEGFLDELAPNIHWEKTDYKFENMQLYVADYNGMIMSKAKAVHDGGIVPRKTDKKDLLLLLKMRNINSISDLDKEKELLFLKGKYNRAYDYLFQMKDW